MNLCTKMEIMKKMTPKKICPNPAYDGKALRAGLILWYILCGATHFETRELLKVLLKNIGVFLYTGFYMCFYIQETNSKTWCLVS